MFVIFLQFRILLLLFVNIHIFRCDNIAAMAPSYVRTNWGVVFNKVGTVLNGITKYRHTFAATIPAMKYTPLQPMSCDSNLLRMAHCEAVNSLTEQVNQAYEEEFLLMENNIKTVLTVIGNVESDMGSGDSEDETQQINTRRKRDTEQSAPSLSPNYCKNGGQTHAGGRGILATLGKVGSDIFGMPTYDDIKIVDKHICELADTVDLNRREIIKSNERLSSISATLNNRISALQHGLVNMNDRVTETQNNLIKVSTAVVGDINNLNSRMDFIESAQEAMYLFMGNLERFEHVAAQHLRYAGTWLFGINKLLQGYIPQELITVDDVQSVLDHVNTKVLPSNTQLRLVHPNPSFYYQVRSTAFTRSKRYVFITLTVPLKSVGGVLGVYRVDRTHIATAEHHTSSTRVANLPDFFAVTPDLAYYTELSVAHYTSCRGEGIRVCSTERALRDANRLTCAAAIFYDKKADVSKHCEIHFEPNDLPSEVIRLGEADYLVHSEKAGPSTTWTLHCPYATPLPGETGVEHLRSMPSCNTCIIKVPCGCSLDGGTFIIPDQLTGCVVSERPGFPEVTKVYPMNLPLLTNLYSSKDIIDVNGSTTHTDPTDSNPLSLSYFNLKVTKSDWKEVVSKDEKYQVDFQRLMKQHKKNAVSYADRAEYYLKKATDLSDLNEAHLRDLEQQFGGELYKAILNPSALVGGISIFWVVAVSTLVMSIYNCWRGKR